MSQEENYLSSEHETVTVSTKTESSSENPLDERQINILNEKSAEERKEYVKKLEDISTKLNETTKKLEETEKTIEQVDRDTIKMTKMNTRCTSFAIVGPSVDFNKIVGLSFMLGFDYRILRNIHIGATLNSSLFTDTKLNGDVGIGLLFGYSIY